MGCESLVASLHGTKAPWTTRDQAGVQLGGPACPDQPDLPYGVIPLPWLEGEVPMVCWAVVMEIEVLELFTAFLGHELCAENWLCK